MKKVINKIVVAGLILVAAFGFSFSSVSASVVESESLEYELNASRTVSHSVYYSNPNVIPPSTYYYSDSLGYKGNIPLRYVIRNYETGNRYAIAVYTGTVHCTGLCPMTKVPKVNE